MVMLNSTIYFADSGNHRVRALHSTPLSNSSVSSITDVAHIIRVLPRGAPSDVLLAGTALTVTGNFLDSAYDSKVTCTSLLFRFVNLAML